MPLLTTIPIIMITAMNEMINSVVWVSNSIQITPMNPSGTVNMMTSGSTSDWNCEAMIMYTNIKAMIIATPRLENAPDWASVCPAMWYVKPTGNGSWFSPATMSSDTAPSGRLTTFAVTSM